MMDLVDRERGNRYTENEYVSIIMSICVQTHTELLNNISIVAEFGVRWLRELKKPNTDYDRHQRQHIIIIIIITAQCFAHYRCKMVFMLVSCLHLDTLRRRKYTPSIERIEKTNEYNFIHGMNDILIHFTRG